MTEYYSEFPVLYLDVQKEFTGVSVGVLSAFLFLYYYVAYQNRRPNMFITLSSTFPYYKVVYAKNMLPWYIRAYSIIVNDRSVEKFFTPVLIAYVDFYLYLTIVLYKVLNFLKTFV